MIDPGSLLGGAQRVADLVRRHLEEDRLAGRLAHRGRLDEVDPDRRADHVMVVHVEACVAERLARRRGDEAKDHVGPLLAVVPAEDLNTERLPGDRVPLGHGAADGRLERGLLRRDEIDGQRETVPRVADRSAGVDTLRRIGSARHSEHGREEEPGQEAASGDRGPRPGARGPHQAAYGWGPATTTVTWSGWRWVRAASFTCGTVTAW
jgi:hypothetical protein